MILQDGGWRLQVGAYHWITQLDNCLMWKSFLWKQLNGVLQSCHLQDLLAVFMDKKDHHHSLSAVVYNGIMQWIVSPKTIISYDPNKNNDYCGLITLPEPPEPLGSGVGVLRISCGRLSDLHGDQGPYYRHMYCEANDVGRALAKWASSMECVLSLRMEEAPLFIRDLVLE
ncbi:hypothetical protein GH714_004875 [Hevea brasiliensis]|uniref:Uncharacterized protein n=1 Tax=Hevea brasiliensis TaxID=3981 RepID=A0A6A6KJW0_HEVBR|nr:hypothetical protein GH714_004875 [Hevea brasiliensis]